MAELTHEAFKKSLKTGEFNPVYLFHGADDYLKEEQVRALVARATDPSTRDFNLDVMRGAEVDERALSSALDALPMLADRRVVVLRDPTALKKGVRAQLDRYLKSPARETLLIMVSPSGLTAAGTKDELKLAALSSSLEFRTLEGAILLKWIAHYTSTACEVEISQDAAKLLASLGGDDLALLAGELRKLATFTGGSPIDVDAVKSVTGIRKGGTLPDLLDCIAQRDTMSAINLVDDVLALPKISGVNIVMALSTQMLALGWGVAARARGLPAGRLEGEYFNLLKTSGSTFTGRSWGDAVKCWARSVSKWKASEIDRALHYLLEADSALKNTGVSDDSQMLTSLILAITPSATEGR